MIFSSVLVQAVGLAAGDALVVLSSSHQGESQRISFSVTLLLAANKGPCQAIARLLRLTFQNRHGLNGHDKWWVAPYEGSSLLPPRHLSISPCPPPSLPN